MPEKSELHKLFKGLLDESPSSGTEDKDVPMITPCEYYHKTGPIWDTKSNHVLVKHNDLLSKGAEMATKRDYKDIPPDAIDATGKPIKKVKTIDLENYEMEETGGNHQRSLPSSVTHQPSVTNEGGMQHSDSDASMDTDQTDDTKQEIGELMSSNVPTAVGEDIVQPNSSSQYCPEAPEICSDQEPPPEPQINHVFLSPLKHNIGKRDSEEMDTIEKEGSEPENDDSSQIGSHKLDKTVMLKSRPDSGLVIEPEKSTDGDQGIMNLIEEAVQVDNHTDVNFSTQDHGEKTIPKPSIKSIPSIQSAVNVSSDLEDDLEDNRQNDIRRPKYKSSLPVRKGYVSWWSNALGKGQIMERHTNEVYTINWWQLKPHYGALHSGVSVEYQREYGKFQKFWVVQGMPYVLYVYSPVLGPQTRANQRQLQ